MDIKYAGRSPAARGKNIAELPPNDPRLWTYEPIKNGQLGAIHVGTLVCRSFLNNPLPFTATVHDIAPLGLDGECWVEGVLVGESFIAHDIAWKGVAWEIRSKHLDMIQALCPLCGRGNGRFSRCLRVEVGSRLWLDATLRNLNEKAGKTVHLGVRARYYPGIHPGLGVKVDTGTIEYRFS